MVQGVWLCLFSPEIGLKSSISSRNLGLYFQYYILPALYKDPQEIYIIRLLLISTQIRVRKTWVFFELGPQGRNYVSSQRWARLENFPFSDFFLVDSFILVHPNKFQWFQKGRFPPPLSQRKISSSPFTIFLLFPLPYLFLPSPFLPNFQGWATGPPCPPLATPLSWGIIMLG